MAHTTFSQTKMISSKNQCSLVSRSTWLATISKNMTSSKKLIEKQLSFFWRPEEVDVPATVADYQALPEHEKHIFISNLKYQTLLDSIQGA